MSDLLEDFRYMEKEIGWDATDDRDCYGDEEYDEEFYEEYERIEI
jgi:hypothetical protein